jgi:hypothetical protein
VGGNNNGILEPGESAEIRLSVSFTNQFGVAHFAPPIGTFTSGTIVGLGSAFLDVVGSGATAGAFVLGNNPPPQTNNGTTGYGVRSGWRMLGNPSAGSVNATGTGVEQIVFGQFFSQYPPETANPINRMYALLWTPASYSSRVVTFAVAGHMPAYTGSIGLDLDGSVQTAVYVTLDHIVLGSIDIPIAPAPPAAGAMALALLARRRRFGGHS